MTDAINDVAAEAAAQEEYRSPPACPRVLVRVGRPDVASALVTDGGGHPLWRYFERVILRDFRAAFPANPQTWGIGPRATLGPA